MYTVENCVRGRCVFKNTWSPIVREELDCEFHCLCSRLKKSASSLVSLLDLLREKGIPHICTIGVWMCLSLLSTCTAPLLDLAVKTGTRVVDRLAGHVAGRLSCNLLAALVVLYFWYNYKLHFWSYVKYGSYVLAVKHCACSRVVWCSNVAVGKFFFCYVPSFLIINYSLRHICMPLAVRGLILARA